MAAAAKRELKWPTRARPHLSRHGSAPLPAAAAVTDGVAGACDEAEGGDMDDEGAMAVGAQGAGASGSTAGGEHVAVADITRRRKRNRRSGGSNKDSGDTVTSTRRELGPKFCYTARQRELY